MTEKQNDIIFQLVKPDKSLSLFVESFWQLHNPSDSEKEIVVLPDGRIELTFFQSPAEPFQIVRSGLETQPEYVRLPPKTLIFGISCKLPAIEYIFGNPVSGLLNYAEHLPSGFWDFSATDMADFDLFCKKASQKISSLLPQKMDDRKRNLFQLVYASDGLLTVKQLSQQVYWSSRQINRYFHQQYGISLKTYCNILRFRASWEPLAQGKFFPHPNFADQSHFIREIKKFSGVSPKELKRNHNDRFIQFSALHPR